MINLIEYNELIKSKGEMKKLNKKINLELYIFTLIILMGIPFSVFIVISAIQDIFFDIEQNIRVIFLTLIVFCILIFVLAFLTSTEPLKNLKPNDSTFIHILLLKEQIEKYKKNKPLFIIKKFQIFYIKNKTLQRLYKIRVNYKNSFIFNSNAQMEIQEIKQISKAIAKAIDLSVKDITYSHHIIELLNLIIDRYKLVLDQRFIEEKNISRIVDYQEQVTDNKMDLQNKVMEIIEMDLTKNEKDILGVFKKVPMKYYMGGLLIPVGIILYYLHNSTYMKKHLDSINLVLSLCIAFSFIHKVFKEK